MGIAFLTSLKVLRCKLFYWGGGGKGEGGNKISTGEGVRYKEGRSGPYAYVIFSVFISSTSEG